MFGNIKNIHFVGIGGIGMSGIAHVLLNMGYRVSGSDLAHSPMIKKLNELGAAIYHTHREENVKDVHVIVYSSAIPSSNPEIAYAKSKHIPIIHRSEMLAELMRLKYSILVAGTHGKTTTTSIIATILQEANFDPTVVIGGQFNNIDSTAKSGTGAFIVCEADESDGSFVKLTPAIALVSNIERDHMDHYRDFAHLQLTFLNFINKIPFYGCAIVNIDDPGIQDIIPAIEKRFITIGTSHTADYCFDILSEAKGAMTFSLMERGTPLGTFSINLPGAYNVYNTVSAIACARFIDISTTHIQTALSNHQGILHRFTTIGETHGILFVDDYAHNPTKIRSVLEAAKNGWKKRIIAIFQPHRYTRVNYCFAEFVRAFYHADIVFVTDIYSAGETAIEGISADKLVSEIARYGHKNVRRLPFSNDMASVVMNELQANDLVITLGAGDIWKIGQEIFDTFSKE